MEDKNSVEKRRKKPIRNVPGGFRDVKEGSKYQAKSIRNVPRAGQDAKPIQEQTKEKVSDVLPAAEISVRQKNEEIFSHNPDENERNNSNKSPAGKIHRNKLITLSVVAAVLLLIFVFRPNILGLGVYDEGKTNDTLNNLAGAIVNDKEQDKFSMNDLGSTIEQLKLEISSGNEKLAEFLEKDINRITGDLVSCLTEKSSLEDNYEEDLKSLEDDLEEKKQELEALKSQEGEKCSELESKFTSLQDSFDLLALNSARSICCKQKVDNWDIDYYDVIGDKIVCLEEGNKSLNCFS